jgi:hypothetical protein
LQLYADGGYQLRIRSLEGTPNYGPRQESSASSSKKIARITNGDVIKVGTTYVIINANNEGSDTFGESTKGDEVVVASNDKVESKLLDPKYSMPRWCPSGLSRSQKCKVQCLREKENREKEVERVFNKTHPEYPQKQ